MMRNLLAVVGCGVALLALGACGDDDGGGGGAEACAHAEMLCADDPDTDVSCSGQDVPAGVAACINAAEDCDTAFNCLFEAASSRAGGGG